MHHLSLARLKRGDFRLKVANLLLRLIWWLKLKMSLRSDSLLNHVQQKLRFDSCSCTYVTMPREASEFVSVYLPQTTWSDVHYFNTGVFREKQNLCVSKYTLVYISCFGAWLILKNLLLMETCPNWLSLGGNLKTQKETLGGMKINSVILFYLEVSVMCSRLWLPGWGPPPHHWDRIWFV